MFCFYLFIHLFTYCHAIVCVCSIVGQKPCIFIYIFPHKYIEKSYKDIEFKILIDISALTLQKIQQYYTDALIDNIT